VYFHVRTRANYERTLVILSHPLRNESRTAAGCIERGDGQRRPMRGREGGRRACAFPLFAHGIPFLPFRLHFRRAQWKQPGAIETHGHLLHFNNGFPSPFSVGPSLPLAAPPLISLLLLLFLILRLLVPSSARPFLVPPPRPSAFPRTCNTRRLRWLRSRFTASFMLHTVREHAEVPYG